MALALFSLRTCLVVALLQACACAPAAGTRASPGWRKAPPHAPGGFALSINESLIAHTIPKALATLNQYNMSFHAPPQSISHLSAEVVVEGIKVMNLSVENMSLKLLSPQRLRFVMHNVSATVPETDYTCKLPGFLLFCFKRQRQGSRHPTEHQRNGVCGSAATRRWPADDPR
ncbi:hypothetical protein ERJ75_001575500 [Trypanosoma vivax]|nr:hypothetical protein ERJ75_001575500 [Trypanosoma vivax]